MVAIPILTNPIADLEVLINTENTTLNLLDNFDDPFTTGLVAQFELFNPDNSFPNSGITEVVLFDQADEGAPLTVENFQNYVEDGDYVNSIIHRSVSDFVIQGGGFFLNDDSTISQVTTDDPVQNEFSSDRSNLEGTIAMAKLGNDPDSATSQWFFNLEDNSETLDNQNGGFTAFGEILSNQDANTINAIEELPTLDLREQLGTPFSDVPFNIEESENPPSLTIDDFVRYESITISQQEELEFAITNNSNPELVEASIEGGNLTLNYLPEETGEAEITIQATNLVGETVEDTFSVAVDEETATPTVNLSVDSTQGSEADETTFTLTATASEAVSGEQSVALTTSGVDGNDFIGDLPLDITIADGETTGSVELTVNDDEAAEGEETATFALENSSDGISLGANTSVDFTIADNDLTEELQGDFNNDGITNLNDLGLFAAAFGSTERDSNYNATVDLTNDGSVNSDDLDQLATFFAEESSL